MSKIQDGLYGYIGGTVESVRAGKTGPFAQVSVQREGAKYPDRVTVWGVPENVAEGDRIKVKGWLSWSRSERDGKTYFNVSLNKPEVVEHEQGSQPASQQWDSTPF